MSWQRSVTAVVAVLVAAASVVVLASEQPRPAAATARGEEQPIVSASLSCPGSPGPSTPTTSIFAVGPDLKLGGGILRVLGAGVGRPTLGETTSTGRPVRVSLPADGSDSGALVKAFGVLAPGVSAAQLSTYNSAKATGTAASWCESPRDQWWFSGVDTGVGTSTLLVLSNPSPSVAVIDLTILGPDGVVDAAGASGVPIGPESRVVLNLARYAPGQAALTLHVTATRGTVAAAVSTTRLDGLTPVGADWVPASASPATAVVVGPSVGGVGRQSLVVANTGTRQQLVSFRILDQSGAFTSTVLPDLQVPPESVVVKGVSAVLDRRSTAIELTAEGPVTGAVVSEQVTSPVDFAVSGVGEPLTAPAVVPAVNATPMTLSFTTARPGPQQVEVEGVTTSGASAGTETVEVKGLATTTWKPPGGWDAAYLVVSAPPGSDVHAVVSYAGVQGVAQLPLLSGRRTVLRPPVLPF